jgi:hypothetical protein
MVGCDSRWCRSCSEGKNPALARLRASTSTPRARRRRRTPPAPPHVPNLQLATALTCGRRAHPDRREGHTASAEGAFRRHASQTRDRMAVRSIVPCADYVAFRCSPLAYFQKQLYSTWFAPSAQASSRTEDERVRCTLRPGELILKRDDPLPRSVSARRNALVVHRVIRVRDDVLVIPRRRDHWRAARPCRDFGPADLLRRKIVFPVGRIFLQSNFELVFQRQWRPPRRDATTIVRPSAERTSPLKLNHIQAAVPTD